jgi:ABC-type branched-subunit amino acid transport system substrate-binding protein
MKKIILLITIIGISIFCSVLFAEVGVTDDQILVGSSLALGGPSSFLGTETLRGLMACINSVNEKGGVNGRKIKVIAYDDGYEPLPCVKNTKKLIENDKVFCLTCYVGTPTSVKAQPIWTNAKVPVVGFFTGAEALRTPFNRYNIHIRASYYDEAAKAVDIFVKDLGLKKIAIFYQYDSFGEAVKKGTEIALQKYGLTPVAYGSFERNTLAIEGGLAKIKDSRPEAIVMVGTYSPLAKFVKEAKRAGLTKTIFYTVSFVGPEAFAKELGTESENVIITTVVPPYETATPLPIVDEYLKALKNISQMLNQVLLV